MARLKLVPWEPTWLDHATLDLHAIYRRPQRDPKTWQIQRDTDGFVQWDLVGPTTIRSHNKYRMKGMEYVTLGTGEDVIQAANPAIAEKGAVPLGRGNRDPNERADDYLRQPPYRAPWDAEAYLADMADERATRLAEIVANLEEFGPDGAERFEQQRDPGYVLPERFRQAAEAVTDEAPKRKRGRPRKEQPEADAVTV